MNSTKTTITESDVGQAEAGAEGLGLLVMSVEAFVSVPLPSSGMVVIGRSNGCDVQLEDPLASRQHARIILGETVEIEDLGSANGTRIRDALIPPGTRVALAPGETVTIGTTVLVLQPSGRARGVRRIWSHRWFERRVREECVRCEETGGRFALVRLTLEQPLSWFKIVPIIDRELAPPHVFAAYGPHDYELLLLEADSDEADRLVKKVCSSLSGVSVASRNGVACYPRDGRTLDAVMAHANGRLRPTTAVSHVSEDLEIEAVSPAMQRVNELARRAAKSHINVLILGETGVGKELMAQSVHRLSTRASAPMLALNCAGLTETLIESELFGHERGAFTGAVSAKKGLFEAAEGGTLFLDEVGEMPAAVQAKVLRAIANREILPVGSLKARPIDVRIVAATNRELEQEVEKGTFRRDLYYRLNGITLQIPPLRERRTEIPDLTQTFIKQAARDGERESPSMAREAADLLSSYGWPGNIRELKNVVERAMVLCEGDIITLEHLPTDKMRKPGTSPGHTDQPGAVPAQLSSEEMLERQRIIEALEANVWNQSRAARALNIPRRTFVSKLERYRIPRPQKYADPPTPDHDPDTD